MAKKPPIIIKMPYLRLGNTKANGKKAEARNIANIVDAAMQGMKFTRTFMNPLPNLDRTIYRITLRWEAIAGEPITTDGTDTTIQMYRE